MTFPVEGEPPTVTTLSWRNPSTSTAASADLNELLRTVKFPLRKTAITKVGAARKFARIRHRLHNIEPIAGGAVCTAPGAPAGDQLVWFGLREGPSNPHPGQGTANRRFFFANAVLELVWVCDRSEEHTSELQSLRHLVCRLLL